MCLLPPRFDRPKLASAARPREEERRPRRGHPRTIFRRALERDNLVLAEVTAREIGRVTIAEASGGELIAFHFQPQGVTGVDLVTGTVFRAVGLTRDVIVNSPPGGSTETFVNQFRIQATGGAQSFIITELFHATVSPDGTVRVFFDKFSSTC